MRPLLVFTISALFATRRVFPACRVLVCPSNLSYRLMSLAILDFSRNELVLGGWVKDRFDHGHGCVLTMLM